MNADSRTCLRAAIEITLVPGLGSLAQGRLKAACPDLSEVFSMNQSSIGALEIQRDAAEALLSHRYASMAEEILDWGEKEGCHFLSRGGPGYPALLEQTFDPPLVLYARGNPRVLENPCIAIVGTRRPTYYGLQMAEGLASDLAQRGIAVVSGMARGIDAAAHRGCLEAGGLTVAVFGCGVDVIYPREHQQLSREILKEGVILSEFPPGTSPSPQNFPVRNRIISGIAVGTLIVEASEYSGSLITARLAMEQNRELFALPGNITSPQSFGPNYLIKQGAKLVQTWRDVVEELAPELRHSILSKEDSQPQRPPELELLSDEEKATLELISFDHATQFDRIYRTRGMEISRLASLLLDLEMRGWIRQVPGNLYIRASRPKR
jgi:DNA processing protein